MKKIVSCLLSMCLIISGTCISFASDASYETAYDYLVQNGVSEEFLGTMESADIMMMYNDLKDKTISQVEYETSELYVNEETGELMPLAEHDLESSRMTLSMSTITTTESITSTKSKIVDVRVYATYVWKKRPTINRRDMTTINWSTSRFAFESGSYSHKVYYNSGNGFTLWKTIKNPTKAEQGGIGISVPFYNTTPSRMKGIISFGLGLTGNTMYQYSDSTKNTKTTTVKMNYTHDATPSVAGIGFTVSGGSISISGTLASSVLYSTSTSSSIKFATK